MNKQVKYGLIVTAVNILIFLLLIAIGDKVSGLDTGLFIILVVPGIILLLELIFGIVFLAATTAQKDLGAGLLMGFGLTLLIGLGVCGVMARM